MTKKKILFVNEFSHLSTGYSTYGYNLIPRLFNTGKYEIAELATYCNPLHPMIYEVPWKVYPNEPDPRDKEACSIFASVKENQFGRWRFEEILLDFQPDIVISIRDFWMDSFISKSPYRKYFKWITMPTVDGQPQKLDWLEMYEDADRVLTYSHWAKNVLETESGHKINVFDVGSPGTDLDTFVFGKKSENRDIFGIEDNALIIQTVMRNQPRKLFPDLMKAFNRYLDICIQNNRYDLVKRSYLYFHTSQPDVGWDLPLEIKKHKLSHKVLFTYMCNNCKAIYPSFFYGDKCHCKHCGAIEARTPNTAHGVSKDVLAKIHSIADLYIQYATNEGFGMPINDAKSCGVPCLIVDYSAMSEQAYNGGAWPIKVQRFFQESVNQTNQLRAYPDNEDAAQKMYNFFTLSEEDRYKLGLEARQCIENYYHWDIISKVWENAIDTLTCENLWMSPLSPIKPNLNIPNNITNEQFVIWLYENVVMQPHLAYSQQSQKIVSILNAGKEVIIDADGRMSENPIDRNKILNHMLSYVQHHNTMEYHRFNTLCNKQMKQDSLKMVIV